MIEDCILYYSIEIYCMKLHSDGISYSNENSWNLLYNLITRIN